MILVLSFLQLLSEPAIVVPFESSIVVRDSREATVLVLQVILISELLELTRSLLILFQCPSPRPRR